MYCEANTDGVTLMYCNCNIDALETSIYHCHPHLHHKSSTYYCRPLPSRSTQVWKTRRLLDFCGWDVFLHRYKQFWLRNGKQNIMLSWNSQTLSLKQFPVKVVKNICVGKLLGSRKALWNMVQQAPLSESILLAPVCIYIWVSFSGISLTTFIVLVFRHNLAADGV